MTEVARVASRAPLVRSLLRWALNPYFQIFLGACLDATGELLLRKGSEAAPKLTGAGAVFGVTSLLSAWTWLGIVSYCLSLVSWLYVLRSISLSIAFPMINVVHALVPLGAWAFLHEQVTPRRWIGISLIIAGILAIMRPLAKAEEKL